MKITQNKEELNKKNVKKKKCSLIIIEDKEKKQNQNNNKLINELKNKIEEKESNLKKKEEVIGELNIKVKDLEELMPDQALILLKLLSYVQFSI